MEVVAVKGGLPEKIPREDAGQILWRITLVAGREDADVKLSNGPCPLGHAH
jgi:hypothetical protein